MYILVKNYFTVLTKQQLRIRKGIIEKVSDQATLYNDGADTKSTQSVLHIPHGKLSLNTVGQLLKECSPISCHSILQPHRELHTLSAEDGEAARPCKRKVASTTLETCAPGSLIALSGSQEEQHDFGKVFTFSGPWLSCLLDWGEYVTLSTGRGLHQTTPQNQDSLTISTKSLFYVLLLDPVSMFFE